MTRDMECNSTCNATWNATRHETRPAERNNICHRQARARQDRRPDDHRSHRWGPILRPSSLGPDGTRGADTPPEDPPEGVPGRGSGTPPGPPLGPPPEGGPGGARGAPRGARAPPCTFLRVFNNSPIRDRWCNKTVLDGFFGGANSPKIAPGGEISPPTVPQAAPRTRFQTPPGPPQDPPGTPPGAISQRNAPFPTVLRPQEAPQDPQNDPQNDPPRQVRAGPPNSSSPCERSDA